MTNLDSIFKSRDMTLPTKFHLMKAMVFPVVMYGCESWTLKKAECRRIDAFELWCWRRLLRTPWTTWRSNQSILKEISPEYTLEGLMLKLKLQSFGHLMRRTDSLEKTVMLGKIEGRRRRGQEDEMVWCHHWFDGLEFEQAPAVGDGQGSLVCCSPWGCKQLNTTEQLRNNTMLSGLPRWLSDKEPTCQCRDAEDLGLIPGSERYPGLGNGNPLQYPYWKNPMDRGALCATVHRVTKSQTQLNDWACTHALCYPRMEWLHNPTKLKN